MSELNVVSKEKKQCHANVLPKLMRKARLIKETLSVSNVTKQIIPHSIACHSLMQFEEILTSMA